MTPRRPPAPPEVAPHVSIADFARARKVPYLRAWRTLRALAQADADAGRLDWLVDLGRGRGKMLSVSRLEAAHPALFHRRFAQREELEELRGRVDQLEESVVDLRDDAREQKKQANARAARLRKVEGDLEQLSLSFSRSHQAA